MAEKFAVMMATYNGDRFLSDQLQSIANQTVEGIDLWLSDDGSHDYTLAIADEFRKKWDKGRFEIIRRMAPPDMRQISQRRANENFSSLVLNDAVQADYYAFSDQDDEWYPEKLAEARNWLEKQDPQIPCLYCTRTDIIDERGERVGTSPLFGMPSFANALVQNIAAGNTMVLNQAAMDVIRNTMGEVDFVSHDWWCYLMVTGVGGKVHYSSRPSLGYRQHSDNLVGENISWRAKMTRFSLIWSGRYRRWNAINLEALEKVSGFFDEKTLHQIEQFKRARELGGLTGMIKLYKSGVCRQSLMGQAFLGMAFLMGKV